MRPKVKKVPLNRSICQHRIMLTFQSPSPQRNGVSWSGQVSEDAQRVFAEVFSLPLEGRMETSRAVAVLPFSVLSRNLAGLLAHVSCKEKPCSAYEPCGDLTVSFGCTSWH